MFPDYPHHLKAFDYVGLRRYFLTFCTFERQELFTASDHIDLVLSQFQRAGREQRVALLAYCFMPDHVHLLVEAQSEDSDARRFIKDAKQYSGFYFKQRFRRSLWQRYGYEHTLRDDEATLSIARYILENPLRSGLVEKVEDYPFIGSDVYQLTEMVEAVASRPRGSG